MKEIFPLAERLAPDTIARLERAAQQRFLTAEFLRSERRLIALYLYGYTAEICLSAAFYRVSGFHPHMIIDRDTRQRRMAQARQLRTTIGEPLMTSDPHPLVGWARFLEWQRKAAGPFDDKDADRLKEGVRKAILIYKHWRPELRYKIVDVSENQVTEVRNAAKWLLDNQRKF